MVRRERSAVSVMSLRIADWALRVTGPFDGWASAAGLCPDLQLKSRNRRRNLRHHQRCEGVAMSLGTILKTPLFAAEILGSSKSFLKNPLIGSPTLNEKGLHRWRVRTAARLAAARRARLATALDPQDVAAFDRDGFFMKRGFLDKERYARLKDEVFSGTFEAREMRQGQTVTRMVPLPPEVLKDRPVLASVLHDPRFLGMIRYAASQGGQ